eukprot:Gb_09980 [translate_table: standard]
MGGTTTEVKKNKSVTNLLTGQKRDSRKIDESRCKEEEREKVLVEKYQDMLTLKLNYKKTSPTWSKRTRRIPKI